ncbi:hypothetical protein ACP4OV_007601 [Aristida adscensionis]
MARRGGSRTEKNCDCCKRYLDHLDEKKKNMNYFLKSMTTNFKHSMIVPNRFLKHFPGKFSGTIRLESPNGCVYDVEVIKRSNRVLLRHGWEVFVEATHIEENDSLLFRHIEKCCFEVLVFDCVGCEKVFPCAGIEKKPIFQERTVDSVDISRNSHHDTTESSASERIARCRRGSLSRRGKNAKIASASLPSEESGGEIPSENESFESDHLPTPLGVDYVLLSQRSYLSEAQKDRVRALIQEIQPESTVFVAVMRKCNVQLRGPYLGISKEYASGHFPHEGSIVTLQMPGKSKNWHPKFYKRTDRRVYMLRGQWLKFIRDNHVHQGDICLLLPTKGGTRFTFTVYLIRAAGSLSRVGTSFQRVGSCHGRSGRKMTPTVHINEESTEGENVSSESDMHETPPELPQTDSGGSSEPPYITPHKCRLSRSQKKIVEETVRAIQSEFPIFVSIMTKSSVGVTRQAMIELGSRFAAPHLPDKGKTVVLQCMGKVWKTKMIVHSGKTRWLLKGGWHTFVRDNGLQVGDICLFELKKNEKNLTMKVHIFWSEQF